MNTRAKQDKRERAQGLRVVVWGVPAGALLDEDEVEAAVMARLEAGEGGQTVNLFDYDALPGDD